MVANSLHSPAHPVQHGRSTLGRVYHSSIPELAVILLAGFVRFWRLGYHSFWFDEAVSLAWAGSDPGYTWRVTFALIQDKHPPGYYIALHYWQQLLEFAGLAHSDVALRAFGALLGVLTVWGAMVLSRRLSGRPTALVAGLFIALAPVLVWYSQELRMFQPATTAIVWAAYCLARAWERDTSSWRVRTLWWVGFVICIELALYTYLFSAFILPTAAATLMALALVGREWRRLAEGTAALLVAGLLFVPLALNAWSVSGSESTPGRAFGNVVANLGKVLQVFTIWRVDWPDAWSATALFLMGSLVLLGIFLPIRRWSSLPVRSSYATVDQVWLAIWIGTPILVANILLGRSRSIFVEDRYLLFMAPFVLWAMARGVVALAERQTVTGTFAGLVVLICLGSALPGMWQPVRLREDWRAASGYVASYQQTSQGLPSAVVAHVDYTHQALEWYLRQQATFDEIPVFFPFGGRLKADEIDVVVAPPLNGIVDFGAATLWLTQSHLAGVDDERLVESWLNERFPIITEQYPAGVKLSGYSLRSQFETLPTLAENTVYPDVELAPGLHLVACEIVTPQVAARDVTMHPPSGWVHVRTWWQLSEPLTENYFSTAQVIGPEGVWGDRLIRQNELMRRSPTSTWRVGDYMREEQDINLNPITPPGVYPVQISVTGSANEAAPLTGSGSTKNVGPSATCGNVVVL